MLLLLGFGIGCPGVAHALRPSRDPLPARLVERPLVQPKGWTRAELGVARLGAGTGLHDRSELRARIAYGVLPRLELRADLGWATLGARGGLADPELAARVSLLRREPPNRSVALELGTRAPAAGTLDELPLGSGTSGVFARLGGRTQYGGLGVTGWVTGAVEVPGYAPWLQTAAGAARWLDPGDRVRVDATVLLQAGPLVLEGLGAAGLRGTTRLGLERGGALAVVDSGALELDAGARVTVQLTRGLDVAATWTAPMIDAGDPVVPESTLTPPRAPRTAVVIGVAL